jgi:hypothetical protein
MNNKGFILFLLVFISAAGMYAVEVVPGEEAAFSVSAVLGFEPTGYSVFYSGEGSEYFTHTGTDGLTYSWEEDLAIADFHFTCALNTPGGHYSGHFSITFANGDVNYTITPPVTISVCTGEPEIAVTQPNSTSVWEQGSTHNVYWNSLCIPDDVEIRLYRGTSLDSTLEWSTPNDGSWEWIIPSNTTLASDYRIKVSSVSEPNVYAYSSYFQIIPPPTYSITVLSPNNDSYLFSGYQYEITWMYQDVTGDVKIELYDGNTFVSSLTGATDCDGSWMWNIPWDLLSGTEYRIKISWLSNINIYDIGDSFTVLETPAPPPENVVAQPYSVHMMITWDTPNIVPFLEVIEPSMGTVWEQGTTETITWNSQYINGSLRLKLYSGITYLYDLASETANDGSFDWAIGNFLYDGNAYRVLLASNLDESLYDFSNYFSLQGPEATEPWVPNNERMFYTTEQDYEGNEKQKKQHIEKDREIEYFKVWRLLQEDQNNPGSWDLVNEHTEAEVYTDTEWSGLPGGTYLYAVVCVNSDDVDSVPAFSNSVERPVDAEDDDISIKQTVLHSNYPNPFNPKTNIRFTIKDGETGEFYMYNTKGQEIVSETYDSGMHNIIWNGEKFSSGVYFYKLKTSSYEETYKMLMLK